MSFLLYRFTSKHSLYRPSLLLITSYALVDRVVQLNRIFTCAFFFLCPCYLFVYFYLFIFLMFQLLQNFFLSIWGPEMRFRAWKKKFSLSFHLGQRKVLKALNPPEIKVANFNHAWVFFFIQNQSTARLGKKHCSLITPLHAQVVMPNKLS